MVMVTEKVSCGHSSEDLEPLDPVWIDSPGNKLQPPRERLSPASQEVHWVSNPMVLSQQAEKILAELQGLESAAQLCCQQLSLCSLPRNDFAPVQWITCLHLLDVRSCQFRLTKCTARLFALTVFEHLQYEPSTSGSDTVMEGLKANLGNPVN